MQSKLALVSGNPGDAKKVSVTGAGWLRGWFLQQATTIFSDGRFRELAQLTIIRINFNCEFEWLQQRVCFSAEFSKRVNWFTIDVHVSSWHYQNYTAAYVYVNEQLRLCYVLVRYSVFQLWNRYTKQLFASGQWILSNNRPLDRLGNYQLQYVHRLRRIIVKYWEQKKMPPYFSFIAPHTMLRQWR